MFKIKKLKQLLFLIVAGYFLVCVYMYSQQGKLLYHPDQHGADALIQAVVPLSVGSKVDQQYHAIVVEPAQQPSQGTVIFYHGNSGSAWKYLHYHKVFNNMGYRMVLAEYPGFGWRSGQPNEHQMVDEGVALYNYWRQMTPYDQPMILVGKSLGTGVAIQVAAQSSIPPSKLVLLTPFSSVTEVAAKKYWMLPVRWLLQDTFESEQHLTGYAGPVSMLIAGKDEVIGSETGFQLLAHAKKRGPTEVMFIPDANHSGWMPQLTAQQWGQLLH